MTILEIIKSCDNYDELIKKSINYMKYLINNSEKYLSEEQTEIISNLQSFLNEKLVSPAYINFKNNFKIDILSFCRGGTAEEKEKGLENLNTYFLKLNSLNEQFDLLCEYGQDIIKGIISQPNPSFIDIYYKLYYFIISFLYNFIYKIKLSPNENSSVLNLNNNENKKKLNEQYYILDSMEENIELNENLYVTIYKEKEYHKMKGIDKTLYELDDVKKILLNHTSVFSLCISILNCLILFEESFKSQFACFFILKRLYFIFPKNRNELEDLISTSLINLVSFDDEVVKESKEIYESFLLYLLQNGEENLKTKLKDRLEKKKDKIKKDYMNINEENLEKINVESDDIFICDFNLHIGCPTNLEILAGDEEERLIEVKYPNSILYIGFNLPYYDINFHLIKYCPNINNSLSSNEKNEQKIEYEDHQYFYEIFNLEKTQGAKIILFIRSPGIYKVIFDNKYSWFTSKIIRYRFTVLKELIGLNLLSSNSNDEIKIENINNSNIIEKIEENDNKKKDDIKEEEKSEENNTVKIDVKSGNTSNIPNYEENNDKLNVENDA